MGEQNILKRTQNNQSYAQKCEYNFLQWLFQSFHIALNLPINVVDKNINLNAYEGELIGYKIIVDQL